MDEMRFYALFNSISFISRLRKVNNKRLSAIELCLRLRRFRLERGSNSRLSSGVVPRWSPYRQTSYDTVVWTKYTGVMRSKPIDDDQRKAE